MRRLDAEFWAQNLLCTEVQGSRPRLLLAVGAAGEPHLLPSHGHSGYCSVGRGSDRDISLALPAEPWDARLRWPAWTLPALPALPRGHEGSRGHWAQAWVSTHTRLALDFSRE